MRSLVGWLTILASIGLGQNWEVRSILPEIGSAYDADIVTDSLCQPHVAFRRSGYGFAYASWAGDSWTFEYPLGVSGFNLDLCFDRSDNPHVVYRSSALCYAYRDRDTWYVETAAAHGDRPSLALAKDGTPRIGFVGWNSDTVKYAYKAADTWNVLTVPAYRADTLRHLIGASLAVDTTGRPGIAVNWYKDGGSDLDTLWLSVFEYDSAGWHRSDVDSTSGVAPFEFWIPRIRVDPQTNLFHIVYRSRGYASGADGNWKVEDAPIPSCGQFACDFVLHRGQPHIVSSGGLFPLQYTWRSAAGWETEWVGPSGTENGSPSIAVDRTGRPHLTFVSVDDGYLCYARRLVVGTEEPAPAAARQDLRLVVRPNPLRGSGRISFALARAGWVDLCLFDAAGRRAATLASGWLDAGRHSVPVPATKLNTGVYFCSLDDGTTRISRKVVLQH